MGINFNVNNLTSYQFLQNLSQEDGRIFNSYNAHFDVAVANSNLSVTERASNWIVNGSASKNDIEVTEMTKAWYNPFQLHVEDDRKLKTAQNLAWFFENNAKELVKNETLNPTQIAKTLRRFSERLAYNVADAGKADAISQSYNKAISTLEKAYREHLIKENDFRIPANSYRWEEIDFLRAFGKTSMFTRMNGKIYVTNNNEIYTKSKPWSSLIPFMKEATPATQKLAMIKRLSEIFVKNEAMISGFQMNAEGMIENLRNLENKLLRNTTRDEDAEIRNLVNKAMASLSKAQRNIDNYRSRSILWNIRWVAEKCIHSPAPLALTLAAYAMSEEFGSSLLDVSLLGLTAYSALSPAKQGVGYAAAQTAAVANAAFGAPVRAAVEMIAFPFEAVVIPVAVLGYRFGSTALDIAVSPLRLLNKLAYTAN